MNSSALPPVLRGQALMGRRLAICAALGLSIAALLFSGAAHSQSFACAYSQSAAQMAICNSEDLLVMDEKLSAMVAQRLAKAKTLVEREALQRDQSVWTGQRNACGADQACLQRSYGERMTRLSGAAELATLARIPLARP
jgi:uncharacterized protein